MTHRPCEYEILDPGETDISYLIPAPTHHDPVVVAAMQAAARARRPRRFAFCRPRTEVTTQVVEVIYGIENADGSAVLFRDGHPFGRYRSVHTAHQRFGTSELYLVWLDPEPDAETLTNAEAEAQRDRLDPWMVSIPYAAFGPKDAWLRAVDILDAVEDSMPGMIAEAATIYGAHNLSTPQSLFCNQGGCRKHPFHDEAHHPFQPVKDDAPN